MHVLPQSLITLIGLHGVLGQRTMSDFLLLETDTVSDQLDQLHAHSLRHLRALAPQFRRRHRMSEFLLIIYQRSWESLDVPAYWRLCNVIPFHKKGVREDRGNYEFVSVRPLSGKIMKKITLATVERLKDT